MGRRLGGYRTAIVVLTAVLATLAAGSAWAPIGSAPDRAYVANGTVYATVRSGDTIYLGGDFTRVGPRTGGGAKITTGSGRADFDMPEIKGGAAAVRSVVADGAGGWFIAGNFSQVGDVTVTNLAHILPSEDVDPAFNPNPNGEVNSIVLSGSTLYAGGAFTSIGGQTRNRIAALSTTTGQPTSWDPNANSDVATLALSGSLLYVGGEFTSIGGQVRNRIAALDTTTGLATTWNPAANGNVLTLAVSGSVVYAGGDFGSIGGQARTFVAGLSTTTGLATSWNPAANNNVLKLTVSGTLIYAGGLFTTIGGQSRNSVAALNNTTGAATSWNPNADGPVRALLVSGSVVYIGGYFTQLGGLPRNYLGAVDITTGVPTEWDPYGDGGVHALALAGTELYAGGYFTFISGQARAAIASLDATDGELTSWNPNVTGVVQALVVSGSTVYVGGEFSAIGVTSRNNIGAIDATTGLATSWNPGADAAVLTLAISGSTVYAGGDFSAIGGSNRNFIGAVPTGSNNATSWNPNANLSVYSIAVSGSTVYAGGAFTSIGGQTRNYLGAMTTSSHNATGWNPNANDVVDAIEIAGAVYVGGLFTTIGGLTRNRIAAIDILTGASTSWNPNSNGEVLDLAISGSNIYAGGNFTSIGGGSRNALAALNASTGSSTPWNPNVNDTVFAVSVFGPSVYAGGEFTRVGSVPQRGFVSFSELPANQTPPVITGTPAVGQTLTTSTGTWAGSLPISYTYKWLRGGVPIAGATASSYVVQSADRGHAVAARVTGTNLGGSTDATSAPVHVAPPNDSWASGTVLTATGTIAGTNEAATGEVGEPNHAGVSTPLHSAWYRLTPTTTLRATITTCGSGFNTALAVYTGASVNALSTVTSNDDSCGQQSSITFTAFPSTLYSIAVDGNGSAVGPFTLNVTLVPVNDDWVDAISVNAGGTFVGSNIGATGQAGEPNHGGASTPLNSAWYKLQPATDRLATITTCGSSFNTVLAAYSGASVSTLTSITSNDDSCGLQSSITFTARQGVLYTIAVDGAAATGSLTLNVSLTAPPPPANDNWANAVDISAAGTYAGTIIGATGEAGEPNHGGVSTPLNSAWYKLNLATDQVATITTCSADFNTTLAAYTGASVSTLTQVAASDDFCGQQSSITFLALQGTLYTVAVDGFGSATGPTSLSVTLAPPQAAPNNNWANAVDVSAGGNFSGTNIGATGEAGEPNHGGVATPLNSVWYRFTTTQTMRATLSTCGAGFNTVLAAYTGASVAALTQVTANDDTCGQQSRIVFTATAGTLYTVAVDGNNNATGPFTLSVTIAPLNDNWVDAVNIAAGGNFSGFNLSATGEAAEPDHAGASLPLNSVWYKLTVATATKATIDTCGSAFNTVLAAYTGASVSALTSVTSSNDSCAQQSQITFTLTPGTLYTVVVDGAAAATGLFTLHVSLVPVNDNWIDAIGVAAGGTFTGTNVGATAEAGEPNHHQTSIPLNSVWYKLQLTSDKVVTIATCSSSFDTVIAAYTGTSVNALTVVTSDDDTIGCGDGTQTRISFLALQGTFYTVAVDGFTSATGSVSVLVSFATPPPPPNDNLANAVDVSGAAPWSFLGPAIPTSTSYGGTVVGGTAESGEVDHAGASAPVQSTWYRFMLGANATATITTCGSGLNTVLAAYAGSSMASLVETASNDDSCGLQSSITFPVTAGTQYRIAVDGAGTATGPFTLNVTLGAPPAAPPNDNWADAQDISATFGARSSTTTYATGETGEPDHADSSVPFNSVWYRFTLPVTKPIQIDTCGSPYNTVIAVYTGASVDALTPVTSNDNGCGQQSKLFMVAQAGVTYTVVADGAAGATGPFVLHFADRTRPNHPAATN